MNTTKFDNLVIASRRLAESSLSPGPPQGQEGQPESVEAGQTANVGTPQPSLAPQVTLRPKQAQAQAQPEVGERAQEPAALSDRVQKKRAPAKKRKVDDNQPKKPRGRPRKYPLPPDFPNNVGVSSPQAVPLQSAPAPALTSGAHTAVAPALLSNGAPRPSGAEQNGPSQPGMSLYEAWSRNQGNGFAGSPSKQAALYALHRSQQQQMQLQQLQQLQLLQQPGQGQQQQAGQPQEHFELPPNGFMALMQEFAPALAGAFQDSHLAAFGFPHLSSQPAGQAAAAALAVPPALVNPPTPVINNPQGPLPAFSQADAARQDALPEQGVVPGLTTRSPSRRKPQKSPIKPQQGALAATASPRRMQQALSQGAAPSSPARAAASPAGRSRAQRKNAATPQRVVPGGVVRPATQAASAEPTAAALTRQAAAAPATPEHMHSQVGAAGSAAQQGTAGQEEASDLSKRGLSAGGKPSLPDVDEDTSSSGELQPYQLSIWAPASLP